MNPVEQAHGIDQWADAIENNPDVVYRILSDVVKIMQADAAPRVGRRPKPAAIGMDDLLAAIYPERFSAQPFCDALADVMDGERQVDFAPRMHVSQSQLSKLLTGAARPDMRTMEMAAKAAGVSPAFFLEWRATKLGELVSQAYLNAPNLSVAAVKRIARETSIR